MREIVVLILFVGIIFSPLDYALGYKFNKFGRGGLFSVNARSPVFDFSCDGKYLWVSETDCYDLKGHKVDITKLGEESQPLPRMKWKSFVYNLPSESGNFKAQLYAQAVSQAVLHAGFPPDEKSENHFPTAGLTFPTKGSPIMATDICTEHFTIKDFAFGKFPEKDDEEMKFHVFKFSDFRFIGAFNPRLMWDVMLRSTVSGKMCHIGYVEDIEGLRFDQGVYLADIELGADKGCLVCSNFVFLAETELAKQFKDKKFQLNSLCRHGFASDNYYVFSGYTGGRYSFFARDYLCVYGFREKRIVRAFRSGVRLDLGPRLGACDVVISADEKLMAVPYKHEITVYSIQPN